VSDTTGKRRWGLVVPGVAASAVFLLAVYGAIRGGEWYWSLALFCVGLMVIFVSRRWIFRVGVQRSGNELVCRYRPLSESSTYVWAMVMPMMGVALIGAGCAPGNPALWLFGGIFILLLCPLMAFGFVRMGIRALLCISPSMLKVRGSSYVGEGASITEIHRDLVQTIEPRRVTQRNWLQVAIVYRTEGASGDTKTLGIGPSGPQVSVPTSSLLEALTIWKDWDGRDPSALMDRIERALRNPSTAEA
jgi:hypothetical protein